MSASVQNPNASSARPITPDMVPRPTDSLDSIPWLPCALSVEVPVVRFTIADLLDLKVGSIVETGCHHASDLPLRVNKLLIGWTEFDVVGDRLAVRITELI